MCGPKPGVENMYALNNLNTRVGDQKLCDPKPSIRNSNDRNNLRSVFTHGNLLPVHFNEVNFRGEIDGQNLHGHQSSRSNIDPNYMGVARILGKPKLLLDLEMNRIR